MTAGWNDRLAALVEDNIVKLVRIVGAIGDDLTGGHSFDQPTGLRHIVLLSGSDGKAHR